MIHVTQAGCCVELAQVVAVHSNNKNSSVTSPLSSSSDHHDHQATASRLRLLHLLLKTACAFLHTPDAVPDVADSEALVSAGMGEAVVLVADGLLASIQTTQVHMTMTMTDGCRERGNNEAPLRLLALCCRLVVLLAGPPSSSSSRSSRFLYPPTAATRQQQQQQHCCDDDPPGEDDLIVTVNLAPTLSSLGLLVTPTPTSIPQPRWEGVPWSHSMGLEPFSTRLFQTDLRKTLSQQSVGSAIAAAYRLRASGCCETIVQVITTFTTFPVPFLMYVMLFFHAFVCFPLMIALFR